MGKAPVILRFLTRQLGWQKRLKEAVCVGINQRLIWSRFLGNYQVRDSSVLIRMQHLSTRVVQDWEE